MPLIANEMKAKLNSRIYAGLQRNFSPAISEGTQYPPIASDFWNKLADAISDIAIDIVQELQTNAEVLPGQPVATSTGGGTTVAPGHIS